MDTRTETQKKKDKKRSRRIKTALIEILAATVLIVPFVFLLIHAL